MVMSVAAAEAAIGLAIIIAIFRHFGTVDLSKLRSLRG
jgi:NADH-quinone oxidoreductase subunit K